MDLNFVQKTTRVHTAQIALKMCWNGAKRWIIGKMNAHASRKRTVLRVKAVE